MSSMKINIKSSTGSKFVIYVEKNEETVAEFKGRLAELSGIAKESQRLIYRGHVLKDHQTIQELIDKQSLQDGHTMHLVRGTAPTAAKPPASGGTASTGTNAGTRTTPGLSSAPPGIGGALPTGGQNPLLNSTINQGNGQNPLLNAMMNPEGLADLQQQLDPNMMREIMDSPMMRNLMDNPELMRQMVLANPHIQQLREQNPQRQALEVARNPSLMNEMLRNTDRQMANIEMMPGGFEALRNMYQNIQAPLMDAATNPNPNPARTTNEDTDNPFNSLFNNTPSAQPMPNPWNPTPPAQTGTGNGAGTTGSAPATGTTNQAAANPFASLLGGAGGAGGLGMPGNMDPSRNTDMLQFLEIPAVLQMLENPAVQAMMQDPAMIDTVTQNNPFYQRMVQENPQMAALMRDPNFTRAIYPEILRTVIQARQGANGVASGNVTTTGPGTTAAPGATTGTPAGQPASSTPTQPDMSAVARMFQAMQMPAGVQQPPQEQLTPEQAEERYRSQLTQLQDMGFFDRQMCIQVLQETNGNVSLAVERLLTRLG